MMTMVDQRGWGKWAWVAAFLGPSLIGLLVFIVIPIVSSFWYAFTIPSPKSD